MKKRIVSLVLCITMMFSVSFADTIIAPTASNFNTENLELFKALIQDFFQENSLQPFPQAR